MKKYELTESQANGILNSLMHIGLLHLISGKDAYVPARDFMKTPVMEVLGVIEDENRKIAVSPDDFAKEYCAKLLASLKKRNDPSGLENVTFETLIFHIDQGDKQNRQSAQ